MLAAAAPDESVPARFVQPHFSPTPCVALDGSLSLDGRAKVRRAAQAAVGDVLAGLQAAPAGLGQASDEVQRLCQRVLPGPEAAAHAAAAAPSKKRQQAEEAIAAAVADALHLLGALTQWVPLLSGERGRAGQVPSGSATYAALGAAAAPCSCSAAAPLLLG